MLVYVLSVNGGDNDEILGVFASTESTDRCIKKCRIDAGHTSKQGYIATKMADMETPDRVKYIYVHERGRDWGEWSLLFTIHTQIVQD